MTETKAKRSQARRGGAENDRAVTEGIRIGAVLPVPGLLREFGVDPEALFAKVGLTEQHFDDPERKVGYETLGRTLELCAAVTRCPHFGLLLGQHFSPVTLGANFYLMRNARTLREALRNLERHFHLHDLGAIVYTTEESEQEVAFSYAVSRGGSYESIPVYDAAVSISMALFRTICGARWRPIRVTFNYRKPADVAPYKRYFGVPLHFNSTHSSVIFSARWLDVPIEGRDPALESALSQLMSAEKASHEGSFAARVRDELRASVLTRSISAGGVAKVFEQNRRALHRRLQAEGTNLRTLVEEVRCSVSQQLLRQTDKSISEIAALLDYSDATAFARAFRKWEGVSPREWRATFSCSRAGVPVLPRK